MAWPRVSWQSGCFAVFHSAFRVPGCCRYFDSSSQWSREHVALGDCWGRGAASSALPLRSVRSVHCGALTLRTFAPNAGASPGLAFKAPRTPASARLSSRPPPPLPPSPPLLAAPLQSDAVESPLSRSPPSLELPPTYLSRKSSPRSLPHLTLFVPHPGSQLCQDIGNCEFRILYDNKKVVPSVCRVCACLRPSLSIHRSSSPGELKDSPL